MQAVTESNYFFLLGAWLICIHPTQNNLLLPLKERIPSEAFGCSLQGGTHTS